MKVADVLPELGQNLAILNICSHFDALNWKNALLSLSEETVHSQLAGASDAIRL